MAISGSLLTSGTSTSTGSDSTASVAPAANALIEVDVTTQAFSGNTPPTVTLSGNGLTYVEVANVVFATGESQRITRFRAMGASPSAGAITISKSGSTCIGCIWSVKQFTGVDTSGTNGSGAYVQTVTNQTTGGSPNTLTLTLAALSGANNAVSAGFGQDNGDAMAPDTGNGYTELSDNVIATDLGMETQWKVPGTTTVTMALSDFISQGGIGSELKEASGDTTLAPTVGEISYSGNTGALALMLVPGAGAVNYDGYAPGVISSFILAPNTGNISFAGGSPSMNFQLLPAEGSSIYEGNTPSVSGPLTSHYVRRHGRCYFQS